MVVDAVYEALTHPAAAIGAVVGVIAASPVWATLSPVVTPILQTANQWFGIAAIVSSTIAPQLAPMVGWLSVDLINWTFVALAVLYVLILARKGLLKLKRR